MISKKTLARSSAALLTAGLASTVVAITPAHADTVVSNWQAVTGTGSLGQNAAPGGTVTRSQAVKRAKDWADNEVPYSPHGLEAPYGWWSDSATGGRYREDCSGLISMAWQLTESLNTDSLPSVASQVSTSDLKPGDALNNRTDGHVILFANWIDQSAGTFNYYAEHHTGTVTTEEIGNFNSSILAGHPTGNYVGLRYQNIADDVTSEQYPLFTGSAVTDKAGTVHVFRINQSDGH
ncbi:hypothetical protein ACQKM5_22415, partial [Kitasatospora sp. NPDC001175]